MTLHTDLIGFGELMLRMTPQDGGSFETLNLIRPSLAGAEANVCVGLSRLGHKTALISTVPDSTLGRAAQNELGRWGVETQGLGHGAGRMGLYFLSPGAMHRPSQILYDRAGSSFVMTDWAGYDWESALSGTQWFHVSGVTAALGPNVYAGALAVMKAARKRNLKISYDGNYRPSLWAGREAEAPEMIRALMDQADLIFGNSRDFTLVLGQDAKATDPKERELRAAERACAAFSQLKWLASTERTDVSADHNHLSGRLFTRTDAVESKTYELSGIVDRIGGGDAFAAGLFHGLLTGQNLKRTVELAMATTCLKHAIWGDFSLSRADDLERFLAEGSLDVAR